MDATQLAAVKAQVEASADLVGNLIGAVDPQLIPLIVIGKAAAPMVPDLINDVENWISAIKNGNDPTDADNAALAAKIAALQHPETL